jgi:hypothetical protein
MTTPAQPTPIQIRRFLPSIALNAVVPLLVYTLVRPYLSSDVMALILAGVIPLLVTAGSFVVRKRLDYIGVISVVGFVVALAAQLIAGGDGLIVKVQGVIVTGPIGALFLLSALVGRPLLTVIMNVVVKRNPKLRVPSRRRSTVLTLVIGGMLTLHAVTAVVLALVLPTPVFLAVANPVGLGIIAAGVALVLWTRRRSLGTQQESDQQDSVQQA